LTRDVHPLAAVARIAGRFRLLLHIPSFEVAS